MRKNILSLSIAAMIGGLAFSRPLVPRLPYFDWPPAAGDDLIVVEPEGIGHILLVPHYTSHSHHLPRLIAITPEERGKVVKVRFRGAASSQDVFDFNLFLAPGDVWKGNQFLKGPT